MLILCRTVIALALCIPFLFPLNVYAACSTPSATEGSIEYFSSAKEFLFCNGTSWAPLSGVNIVYPPGAVVAFDLTSCPLGWSPYLPARGRFVRGIDNGAGIDPNGTRAPGNLQADALQDHRHTTAPFYTNTSGGDDWKINLGGAVWYNPGSTYTGGPIANGGGTPRVAVETRPVNVALLYCRKN